MQRARKGGEIGMNGMRYEGGQFLPNTTLPKQASRKFRKGKKEEVAPYTWEVAPTETARPIYKLIAGSVAQWAVRGERLERYEPCISVRGETILGYTIDELIDGWNAGERWVEPREE